MAYGTLNADTIASSGTLNITGNIVPSGGIYSAMTPGINRIINGNMIVDQRNSGTSQTITAGATLAYTVDRWYAYCTGANVTGQRVANSGTTITPSQFAYSFTGTAGVTAIGFAQRIEAVNCYDLAGTTATLSVSLANSLLTTVTWTAYYASTADTFGTLASPTRTQIATGTFTVAPTIANYSTQINIPSAATTGIEIVFTVGAQITGTWTIGSVQLEAGTLATAFERRSITQELLLCQRYYYKHLAATAYTNIGAGRAYSTTNAQVFMGLPVSMRVLPTFSYSALTDWNSAQTSGNITAITLTEISADYRWVTVNTTSTYTNNQSVALNANNKIGAWVSFYAEL